MIDQLSRPAFEAGAPCPACGVPWQGSFYDLCLMETAALDAMRADVAEPIDALSPRHVANLVALGLARRDGDGLAITKRGRGALNAMQREEKRFARQHGDCRAGRQTIAGGHLHCLTCCPPPPLSATQIAKIATLLRKG